MLCQFIFKNFYSYKNETVFDMQSENSISNENSVFGETLLQGQDNKKFLPVSVVYGPNGGGKSNLLKALCFAIDVVMKPIYVLKARTSDSESVEFYPFAFDNISAENPTEFTLFFRPDSEYEYKYHISIKNSIIISEYLYIHKIKAGGPPAKIFERIEKSIELGSSIKRSNINTNINDQMPYISFLHINYNIESINTAINWFANCIMRNYGNSITERQFVIFENDTYKDKIITLLNEAGINISDYSVVKKADSDKSVDIFLQHKVNEKKYLLDLKNESKGTQKLFNIMPYIIIALTKGSLLIIDELDAKLHPKLLKFIIMLFKNPDINKNNAQLIFTSHDISTMKSSVFRTDEIWFACKLEDESSDLYSLYEIRDENGNHIQPSAAFDKQYLEGRYGADPYFRNMMDWE